MVAGLVTHTSGCYILILWITTDTVLGDSLYARSTQKGPSSLWRNGHLEELSTVSVTVSLYRQAAPMTEST